MVLHGFDRELALASAFGWSRVATCALAAAALAWAMEIDGADVMPGWSRFRTSPAILSPWLRARILTFASMPAQTPDEIAEALTTLRGVAAGRVHLVMSAEGNGDRAERRQLAEIAENGADRVILTLSNPRTEDPNQIIDDLLAGFRRPGKVRVELDRQMAHRVCARSTPGLAMSC